MTQRFSEPKTEAEARELERFLKEGGETSIKTVESFPGAAASANLREPAVVKFSTSVDALARAVGAGANRRVLLRIEVTELQAGEQFTAELFLNKPAAARPSADDPSYIGSIGFFLHGSGHPAPPGFSDKDPAPFEVDITRSLRRLPQPSGPLAVTIVLVPITKEPPAALRVRSASLNVIESTVRRKP